MARVTTELALRSVARRRTAMTAAFVAVLLATAVMGSFTPMIAMAITADLPSAQRETLFVLGGVVGGWGIVIALFAVASTVAITAGQREVEIGLLRTIGATSRQVRRMVRVETQTVALVAAVLGGAVALLTSRALLAGLRSAGIVAKSVQYDGGPVAIAATALVLLVVAGLAASLAVRRATRGTPSVVPSEGRSAAAKVAWWRWLVLLACLGHASTMAVLALTDGARAGADPYDAMAYTGSLGILVGVGFAVVSPALLRLGAGLLRPVLGHGASGWLAAYNTSRRAGLLAGVLGPVIVLTATTVSVLMVVGIDRRTLPGGHSDDAELINLLNNVITAMICTFAAILVVNAFVAVLAHRRAELHRLHLLGATRQQVEGLVLAEALVVALVGVVFGLVAALFSTVPFGLVRSEGVVPDGQLWLPPLLVAGVVALTLAAAKVAVSRAYRAAVEARR